MSALIEKLSKVAILGAGQMGSGITQVIAQRARLPVYLYDVDSTALKGGLSLIDANLTKEVNKGTLSMNEYHLVISRIQPVSHLKYIADADIVIEAIKEDTGEKIALFKQLSSIIGTETIVASNTSSISITKLASAMTYPERVIGMHFMNPVPKMPLIEVIKGLATSENTVKKVVQFSKLLQKEVTYAKDFPGFIANRLLMPYINEAIFALAEGIASRDDIDLTMKQGCNMPMGPLELADFIGLDTCLSIMQILHVQFGDSKYRPCVLLVQYAEAGYLGRKTGKGFYSYSHQ